MLYDCIIIGAGPAGITAAVYAARKGMKIKVISTDIGGQVAKTSVVENYTGYQEITGAELAKKFNDHLKEFNFGFTRSGVKTISKTTPKLSGLYRYFWDWQDFSFTGARSHIFLEGWRCLR